jgi:hypothetical protein
MMLDGYLSDKKKSEALEPRPLRAKVTSAKGAAAPSLVCLVQGGSEELISRHVSDPGAPE